ARREDSPGIDALAGREVSNELSHEPDVVDAMNMGGPAAPAGVPRPAHPVGVGDEEAVLFGQLVPSVGLFGLARRAEASVEDHDEGSGPARLDRSRLVEAVGALPAADGQR